MTRIGSGLSFGGLNEVRWCFCSIVGGLFWRVCTATFIPMVNGLRTRALRGTAARRSRCALQHRLRQGSARLQRNRAALPEPSRRLSTAGRTPVDQDALRVAALASVAL